jgi:DNA-binding FadR family transcriptional regulator
VEVVVRFVEEDARAVLRVGGLRDLRVEVRIGDLLRLRGGGERDLLGDSPGPFELLRARRTIEGEVAAIAATAARSEDIDAIAEALAMMKKQIEGGDTYETGDRLFHVRIAEATQNFVLVSVVKMLWDLRASPVYASLLRHTVTDGVRKRSIADHARILKALAARDSAGAKAAMQKHLDRVAREYERDWPLVASELTGHINGRVRLSQKSRAAAADRADRR